MSNSIKHSYPWTHWTTDDFLSHNDYHLIKTLMNRWPKGKPGSKVNILLAEFHLFKETYLYQKEAGLVDAILMKYAKKLAEQYSIEGQYEVVEIAYSNCGKGYHYPNHCDSIHKVLSNILYMSDRGDGTRLFETNEGDVAKESPWKSNRLFTFKRDDNTWHDYISRAGNRSTISINFVSAMGDERLLNLKRRKAYAERKNITVSIWPEKETRLTLI
jgi:hypothetical protein